MRLNNFYLSLSLGLTLAAHAWAAPPTPPPPPTAPSGGSDRKESCFDENNPSMECSEGGAVGVTAPLLGDTLDANPAMLPSEPTPFGLEVMGSDRSPPRGKKKLGISTVQGFDGLGFGVGTLRHGAFNSPNLEPHFLGTPAADRYQQFVQRDSSTLGIRLGSTVVMPSHIFPKFVRYSLGASVDIGGGFGKDWSPQVGGLVRIFNLGLGYSENFSRIDKDLPRLRISIASAGIYFPRAFLSYNYTLVRSSVNRTRARAWNLLVPCESWIFYGGWKYQADHRGVRDNWFRGGIFRRLGTRARIGYDYGYYRFAHSAIFQLFL